MIINGMNRRHCIIFDGTPKSSWIESDCKRGILHLSFIFHCRKTYIVLKTEATKEDNETPI